MDISVRQTQVPPTDQRLQLGTARAATPGLKTQPVPRNNRPTATMNISKHPFMHSGYPRQPLLPPLTDNSPRHPATRNLQTEAAGPVSAALTYAREIHNTTPGYIIPGQTSARAYPKLTAAEFATPAPEISDLAMLVASEHPGPTATRSHYDDRTPLSPSSKSSGECQQVRQASVGEKVRFVEGLRARDRDFETFSVLAYWGYGF